MRSVDPRKASRAIITMLTALLVASAAPTAEGRVAQPVGAQFEGHTIDLSKGWGEAAACLVLPTGAECFRSIDMLTEREAATGGRQGLAGEEALASVAQEVVGILAVCSTPLRLYDGTFLGAPVLSIATRGLWINLSTYGFDNRTSSYLVGACAVELAAGTNGAGGRYPRCLYAYCQESVMLSGWDNVLSSAYLK